MKHTTIRVDLETRDRLHRLADDAHTTLARYLREMARHLSDGETPAYLKPLEMKIDRIITTIDPVLYQEDGEGNLVPIEVKESFRMSDIPLFAAVELERFEKESCLSSYCGVSPVMWQSGTSAVKAKRRKRYNRRLKGILFFISLSQIRLNPESRDYYWRKRKEGKTHWQAMNALSRQLIKVIYYMLTNRECYKRENIVHKAS